MLPPLPEVPAQQTVREPGHLRYEDVAQDGHLALSTLPHISGAVWRRLLGSSAAAQAGRDHGIVPILARLAIVIEDVPIHPSRPVEITGRYQLAHEPDGSGGARRVFLNMWAELAGTRGRVFGGAEGGAGELTPGGRVFSEHVFTRLFAPPDQRKVTSLPPPMPAVPDDVHDFQPFERILDLPEDAEALEGELAADAAPVVFGLAHTDSNQHVNSLVYPRLFEEAALRRLADLGCDPARRFACAAEIGYRKPCFSGERMDIVLRSYRRGDRLGAVGVFRPAGDPSARPHCFVRLELA